MITSFTQLLERVKTGAPMRLACAAAQDDASLLALSEAERQGIAVPLLVGCKAEMDDVMQRRGIRFTNAQFVEAGGMEESCAAAVRLVREGQADFLMKGFADSSIFLKAILNRQTGLPVRALLSHVMTFDTHGAYHKLLLTTDGGMVPDPDLDKKKKILCNALCVARALEIDTPKVAVLCAKEKPTPRMPATMDAAELKQASLRGEFGEHVIVEGPIAMDIAVSAHAAAVKHFLSPVSGDADILLMPSIEAGNIMGKTCDTLFGADAAGVVVGCDVPIVMSSRADSDASKLYSIAMGSLMAQHKGGKTP